MGKGDSSFYVLLGLPAYTVRSGEDVGEDFYGLTNNKQGESESESEGGF